MGQPALSELRTENPKCLPCLGNLTKTERVAFLSCRHVTLASGQCQHFPDSPLLHPSLFFSSLFTYLPHTNHFLL